MNYDLEPTIGYLVHVWSKVNSQSIYISHNTYREVGMAILYKDATYNITNKEGGQVQWTVQVVKVSTVTNQQTNNPGSYIACAPPVGPSNFSIVIQ